MSPIALSELPPSAAAAATPSLFSFLSPLQLLLSGALLLLLFVVFGFGIRFRNHPAVSLHCILLGLILSFALFFLGQFFADWSNFSITSSLARVGAVDPNMVVFENSFVAMARAVAGAQALFGLLLTAILVLLRTRQT